MSNRIKYSFFEYQRHRYFQMPWFLFSNEFAGLGNDARLAYALLRDRHELSVKNKWIDDEGYIYLFYSRAEMAALLEMSNDTATKVFKRLKHYGLIEEVRQGLGKPNRIYLLIVDKPKPDDDKPDDDKQIPDSANMNFKIPQKSVSGYHYLRDQDIKNIGPNKTYMFKKTYKREREAVAPPQNDPPPQEIKNAPPNNIKEAHGRYKNVMLSKAEYLSLVNEFGLATVDDYISRVDLQAESKGTKYKNHEATIRKWIHQDMAKAEKESLKQAKNEQRNGQQNGQQKRNRFANFKARERDYEEIERLEQEYLIKSVEGSLAKSVEGSLVMSAEEFLEKSRKKIKEEKNSP